MPFRQRIIWLFSLALLAFGLAFITRVQQKRKNADFSQLALNTQAIIQQQISSLNKVLAAVSQDLKNSRLDERYMAAKLSSINKPAESAYYLFEGSELRYWSDNKVLPDPGLLQSFSPGQINFIGNGWYFVSMRKIENKTLLAILPVQYQYLLQNQYLLNSFNPVYNLPEETHLLIKPTTGSFPIRDKDNHYLFSISFTGDFNSVQPCFPSDTIYFIGCILLLLLLLDMLSRWGKTGSPWGIFLAFTLIVFRFIMVRFRFPGQLYESELFSPKYYASSYLLNSLGDLLVSVTVFVLLVIFFYNYVNRRSLNKHNTVSEGLYSLLAIFIFLLIFLFSVLINYLLSGLIINSQISFNIGNVFELTAYSLIGMLIIAKLLLSLYLMCDGCIRFMRKTGFSFGYISILFLISQGLFLLVLLIFRSTDLFADYGVSAFLLANLLILFISYIRSTERRLFSFSRTVLVIIGFSVYAAQIIYTFNNTKEKEKRQLFAAKIENEQDLVAEYLFVDIDSHLQSDRSLQGFFKLPPEYIVNFPDVIESLSRKLMRQYFSGYLTRYEVTFKYFTGNEIPINRAGDPTWNLDEFNKSISTDSRPTYSNHFYFLPNQSGRISYLGKIEVSDADNKRTGIVIVELNSRFVQEENGFPDLLLSNKIGVKREIPYYSYARYQNGKLISQSGNYNYYLTSAPYEEYYRSLNGMRFTSFDHYSHLFYKFGDKGLIIVSTPTQGILVFITLFSYIFTCFSLTFLTFYLVVRWVRNGFKLEVNFKSRIQLTIVSIVVATLALIGISTVTYIFKNYEQAQNTRIREKLNNVLVLIQNELGSRNTLGDQVSDDLTYGFSQLSNTLSVDFNIYGLNGILLFSSQPKIYEQELMAPLMNRNAYQRLTANQKALYIQSENIGKLSYLAAYEPIRNSENKIIGYIGLPYFAKETELNRDISAFLVALINIYVFLFSIAILLAFFISNRITQPLRIIQQNLKKTKLGTANEPIKWKQKDEIGALINEYNRMVEELHQSAELLAKSERESAWREMAKQVAHEIKNPLTPMRLGVQHVQRAWLDNIPDKELIVQKMCNTLIEQIDTLSNIATEFSHFAKMPKPEYTRVDLGAILEHLAVLYNESERIHIELKLPGVPLKVKADKDQLLRIFSNLIKNAIQAIPEEKEGKIVLFARSENNMVIISVIDNGEGIPKNQLEKIFVPNFTTKTGGTGLGLAMVKSMVEAMGGSVWFSTEPGIGTIFNVQLHNFE